jgi:uncharacterized protein YkwD
VDESRITNTQWQAALSRGIVTRRAALARLIGLPVGLTLCQVSQLESDTKGKKGKKKKKKQGKGKKKGGGGTSPPPSGGGNGAPLDAEESAFLTQINAYRASKGQGPLTANSQLNGAADGHSVDMATRNYFDHVSPSGSTYEQRAEAQGYTNSKWLGENILAGYETASAALEAWKNSPPHNTNMLKPEYAEIGIGRTYNAGSKYGWYWTTVFGTK